MNSYSDIDVSKQFEGLETLEAPHVSLMHLVDDQAADAVQRWFTVQASQYDGCRGIDQASGAMNFILDILLNMKGKTPFHRISSYFILFQISLDHVKPC